MTTAAKGSPYPYRTTLSLTNETGGKLKARAKQMGMTPLQAVRLAVEQFVADARAGDDERSGAANRHALSLANLTQRFENPYQEILAAWRMSRTRHQITDLMTGFRLDLDAWPAEIYLLRVLTELLHTLGRGDEFLVITNVGFWLHASAAEAGEAAATEVSPSTPFRSHLVLKPASAAQHQYLAAQRQAVARGMRLSRLFLLSQDEWQYGTRGLDVHRRFVQDMDDDERSRVRLRCRRVDDMDAAIAYIGHFACIRRVANDSPLFSPSHPDAGALVVEPVYKGRHIRQLRLLLSRGESGSHDPTRDYLARFFAAADEATTIPLDQVPGGGDVPAAGTPHEDRVSELTP
jgi:hypothetical protein